MKLLVAIGLLVTSSFAHGASLSSFVGKYELGKCTIFSGKRFYVGYLRNKAEEVTGLSIYAYGDDASGTTMMVGDVTKDNSNFPSNPIKQVRTRGFFNGDVLVNTQSYIYADGREERASTTTLSTTKKGIRYVETDSKGGKTSCEMKRADD